jgi:WD40 repeat protein
VKKLLVLTLNGDFATGFDLNWEISLDDGQRPLAANFSKLALLPAPELVREYQQWQRTCRSLSGSRIKQNLDLPTSGNFSDLYSECQRAAERLRNAVNQWFDSSPANKIIHEELLANLEDEYRVVICTDNPQARQIPWLLWQGWERYRQLEISLGAPYTQRSDRIYQQQVRILVILGNSDGINIEADRQILAGYGNLGAYLEFLPQPTIAALRQQLLAEGGWDIISFSGHSNSDNITSGRIFLNQTDSLTMTELRAELTVAIERGLQIALFNSCDGLGIAAELEALHIPQVIVMRQPVPDLVAQDFLKHFLAEFTSGKSLYQSVSIARRKLQQLEWQFPCASWLPTIVQNRLEIPPTWQSLGSIPKSPYRGLAAFTAEDKDYFFGRVGFTRSLIEAVNSRSIVPVIGASGSGKSSVVCAGLIPQLKDWQILYFRPKADPIQALAMVTSSLVATAANKEELQILESKLAEKLDRDKLALFESLSAWFKLTNHNRPLLLVVDQFEELYTLTQDANKRDRFLDNILTAIERLPQVKLLFTLRADCYQYLLDCRQLITALETLLPMSPAELTDAIALPAHKLNVQFEAGLIEKILDAVKTDRDSLPLLEFALTQLWEKQHNGLLTHQAYQEIGGVARALVNHAAVLYQQFEPHQRERIRDIFIQLIQVGDNNIITRRIAKRAEIGKDNWELIDRLATGRLVVTKWDDRNSQETVELIHEALIQHWKTFKEWIEFDKDFRRWQEQLRFKIEQWENSKRDENELLRGKELDNAADWMSKKNSQITSIERDFITQSSEKQLRENICKKRSRLAILGSLIFGLITVSVLWIIAESQKQLATNTNIKAIGNNAELLFNSGQQSAALDRAKDAVALLDREGKIDGDIRVTALATLSDILALIHEKKTLFYHNQPVTNIAYSQDGQTIISVSSLDWQVNIYSNKEGKVIQKISGEKAIISPDGKTIFTVSNPREIQIWQRELQTEKWSKSRSLNTEREITAIALSNDGENLAVATNGGAIQLYRNVIKEPQQKPQSLSISDYIEELKFTADGRAIALTKGKIKIWTQTGQLLKTLPEGRDAKISTFTISPNGNQIAGASEDGKIYLWDLNGNLITSSDPNDNRQIKSLSFSPDSQILASAGKEIKIWNISNRKIEPLKTITKHTNTDTDNLKPISFNPNDRQTLVSGSEDGSVRLWQIDPPTTNPQNFPDSATDFNYSNDGRLLFFSTVKGNVKILDTNNNFKEIGNFRTLKIPISKIGMSFDRQFLATIMDAPNQPKIQLWTREGKPITTLSGYQFSFSPTQSLLAVATENKIFIYELNGREILNGRSIRSWVTQQANLTHLSFTPDGNSLITGDRRGAVKFWSLEGTSQEPSVPNQQGQIRDISSSPDGNTIAIVAGDPKGGTGQATIWSRQGKLYPLNSKSTITSLTFSHDGKVLLTGNKNGKLQLWSPDGCLLKELNNYHSPDGCLLKELNNYHHNEISKVRFGANDREFIAYDSLGQNLSYHNLNLHQLLERANNWQK